MDKIKTNYMAIDQYGETYHNLGAHPRKGLLDKLGATHASKMYRDTANNGTVHVGYIVRGLWLSLYEVKPFARKG